ncbi:MAG: MFS transporter [Sulfitobacter sp.]
MLQHGPEAEPLAVPTPSSDQTGSTLADEVWTPLWLGVALLLLGSGLLGTLLGVRAGVEGFTTATVGIIMSAYFLGYLAGSRIGPMFIHRVGHIRTYAALAAIAAAAAGLHAIFVSPFTWIVLRALTGVCLAGLYIVMESWINASATNRNRGHLLSIYMIVNLGGLALGQQLLNLFEPAGFQLFMLSSLLISLSLVPFALTNRTAPKVPASARLGMRALLHISPLGIIGCFAVGMSNGAFWGMAPVFAQAVGLSVADIAIFMSVVILGGIAGQWPIGRLSDRLDRRLVIAVTCILCATLSGAIFVWSRQSELVLFCLGFLFGGFALTLYSLCVAHTDDHMDQTDLVDASGALLGAFGLGAILGPAVSSLVMTAIGPEGLFLYIAVVTVCLGGFALYRILTHEPTPTKQKNKFVAVPETTPIVHELDPRVDRSV